MILHFGLFQYVEICVKKLVPICMIARSLLFLDRGRLIATIWYVKYLHRLIAGYKPAVYVGGIFAVDVIFTFPVRLSTIQFTTTTCKPTQVTLLNK